LEANQAQNFDGQDDDALSLRSQNTVVDDIAWKEDEAYRNKNPQPPTE